MFCAISLHGSDGQLYNRGVCARCKQPISQHDEVRRVWGGDELFHEACWVEERESPLSPYFKALDE